MSFKEQSNLRKCAARYLASLSTRTRCYDLGTTCLRVRNILGKKGEAREALRNGQQNGCRHVVVVGVAVGEERDQDIDLGIGI